MNDVKQIAAVTGTAVGLMVTWAALVVAVAAATVHAPGSVVATGVAVVSATMLALSAVAMCALDRWMIRRGWL